ncbi:hypothetical protein [Caldimonas tepidiphila]|uniref:hypothetical protein n=1 Tax=Caldimonas tepidiphila TaxID=2315841 RepID=UPI000E5A2BFB|nr:hypothetical protein [Caldimonas tepidiphila]
MVLGTVTEINRSADRVGILLNNGQFAVCRLLDRRGALPLGEAVSGRLAEPGACMLTALGSKQEFRVLVLAVYQSKASALELVYC